MTPVETFASHIEKMKQIIQEFYDSNKELPKEGFDEEHNQTLNWNLKRIEHVLQQLEEVHPKKYEPLEEWFKYENRFLKSYHDEPVDNYIHALMNTNAIFRSMGDLWHQIH